MSSSVSMTGNPRRESVGAKATPKVNAVFASLSGFVAGPMVLANRCTSLPYSKVWNQKDLNGTPKT